MCSFCLNLSRSRASRRCERECRTKAHHGRKLNGMTIALISAKGGSRSERAQTQTAQAKTSCGEPRPSKRPRGCRPHGSQPLDSRSGIRPFGYCRCNPLRQPLWDQTLWVLSVQQHGNHVKSSLRRGMSEKSPRCIEARNRRDQEEQREEAGEKTQLARAPPHCTERTKPHRCTAPPLQQKKTESGTGTAKRDKEQQGLVRGEEQQTQPQGERAEVKTPSGVAAGEALANLTKDQTPGGNTQMKEAQQEHEEEMAIEEAAEDDEM